MDKQTFISENDWSMALKKYGGPCAEDVVKNPKLFQATVDVLKSVTSGSVFDTVADTVALGDEVTSKTHLDPVVKQTVRVVSFSAQEAKLTMSLTVLGVAAEGSRLATVGGAVSLIGATVITKTGLVLQLAGDDHAKAKCAGAIMEVAGNVGATALTWETGVGAVLGVASIAASSLNAYYACKQ